MAKARKHSNETPKAKPLKPEKLKPENLKADILIVGGGLAGLTLASVLGRAGFDVICVDRDTPADQQTEKFDGRTTAISWASHRVLQAAGVWDDIAPQACPILDIRVADGASPLFLHFAAEEDGDGRPFGWIVENFFLRRVLARNISKIKNVRHIAPAAAASFFNAGSTAGVVLENGTRIAASLLIGADGRGSATRKWLGIDVKHIDYKQQAIVCTVAHALDHENVAIEHFLPAGPFAALPMTDDAQGRHRSSVVWSVHGADAADIIRLPRDQFDARLQALFGTSLGAVKSVSEPAAWPLTLQHAQNYTGPRTILLAEAAHAIHPIAGQGLNVSMRDIAVLAELVFDAARVGSDIGTESLLASYESLRRQDVILMNGFTDVLNRLFSNNLKAVAGIRDLGIGIIDKIPPAKRFFARQAMGLGGVQGRIIRDGRL